MTEGDQQKTLIRNTMNKIKTALLGASVVLTPALSFAADGNQIDANEQLSALETVVDTAMGIGGVVLVAVLGYFAVSLGVKFIKKARASA